MANINSRTGMPELPVGDYILEVDKQAKVPDRRIHDLVKVKALQRDEFACKSCGWSQSAADP